MADVVPVSLSHKALTEACCASSFGIRRSKGSSRQVLELDISDWLYVYNASFLEETTSSFQNIRLIMKNVQGLDLRICALLSDTIGSKIMEIQIEDCHDLSWSGEIKRIISKCQALEVVIIKSCKWVNDFVLEQLAIRFQKSLTHLELENLTEISNNGIYQLGRRCSGIHTLHFICCPKITDIALEEMSKKNRLSELNISHNVKISDKGIETLLSSSRQLESVVLVNCPKLTNAAVGVLYEANAAWGKKRNTESHSITHLELRDNSNYSDEILLWISACLPHVSCLDIRDCDHIMLDKGMGHLLARKSITTLRVGPTRARIPLDGERFLQCMLYLAPHLQVLHLEGLSPHFTDDHCGELVEAALNLTDISLVDFAFGTATVESICSNVPNLSRIQLVGSSTLLDKDMRCLTMICRNLLEVTVQRCPRLTDNAFTRMVSLKHLHKLDLAHCSPGMLTDGVLKFLTLAPLSGSLVLDGLVIAKDTAASSFACLMSSTLTALTKLSLRQCPQLTLSVVQHLLERFVGCRTVDVTDGPDLPAAEVLAATPHQNPFLQYTHTSDFSGWRLLPSRRPECTRFWAQQRQLRKHYGAKLMQRLRRRYLRRLLDLKENRRERWSDFKHEQVVRIQCLYRGVRARRPVREKLQQGRRLVWAARGFLVYQAYAKRRRARRHYDFHLQRRVFHWLRRHQAQSHTEFAQLSETLRVKKRARDLRVNFRRLLDLRVVFKDMAFADSAGAFYEVKFLERILRHWRTVVFETRRRNTLLVRKFLACAELSTYNSHRQLLHRRIAEHFCERHLLMAAWLCFARDYLVIRRINSLVPMALEHAAQKFFHRVVGGTFQALISYHDARRIKRAAKKRAIVHSEYFSKLLACRQMWLRKDQLVLLKERMGRSNGVRTRYLTRLAFRTRFPVLTRHTLYFKAQADMVDDYLAERRTFYGWHEFKVGVIESKIWRVKVKKAETMYETLHQQRGFDAWCEYKVHSRNLGALMYKRYMQKWQRKILFGLKLNVALNKEYLRALELELQQRTQDEAAFVKFMNGLTKFQAFIRGTNQRARYEQERIEKLYSIQLLQNFFRTCLARKQFFGRMRKGDIMDRVKEDMELDLMREADAETMYYNYQINAIISFQRLFRGWKGRNAAFSRAVDYYRDLSIDYYEQNQHTRLHHEAFKRAAIARENQLHKAATNIEKVARGMFARRRFVEVKRLAKMDRYTVYVQREYRRRLAQQRLQALKRDKKGELRFGAARRQRGLMMRLLGFKNRKQQSQLGKVLDELGMDPLSFNYRMSELFDDTVNDFWNFVGIMKREKSLVDENGLNRLAISQGRRKILTTQGWKLKVQDAVRIIEEGHPYEGFTGVITRIDESLLGVPLYEISLDRYINRQTFVRMTTDAFNTYKFTQPIVKITRQPDLSEYEQAAVIFGLNPDDPMFDKKHVNAAWTIQRGFRVYRSRKIAARKRYELWLRSAARQWSLMNHLAETNTLNTQAYNVAGIIGVRPRKPVHFEEMRHPFQPARLFTNVRREKEAVSIKREYDMRYRDRIAYLQKCALLQGQVSFATGYEKLSFFRKFKIFRKIMYGKMFKKKADMSIQDMRGAKGIKFLANQQSMVTGLDRYCFEQFNGSPHVRYYKTSMYQGEWSGIPLFTPLFPHGRGLVVFLDGWGFAKEDKVLYLTIVKCRYLNAMDLSTSDPYCEIHCNGMILQSSVKWQNLNPDYHESFEIDVTNPSAKLNIIVKDKDYFGSDDFMGQVILDLFEFGDGKEHEKTYQLLGEDVKAIDDTDRGEITIRLRWAERKFEDDQAREALRLKKLIQLQAWVRRIYGLVALKKLRKERAALMKIVRQKAIKITSTCRMRLARKELKRRNRFRKNAIRIQKRVRIWIAKKVFRRKKLRHHKAVMIQSRMRVYLAKALVQRIRDKMSADLNATVIIIQKNVRRMIALHRYMRHRAEEAARLALENGEDDDSVSVNSLQSLQKNKRPPLSTWLPFYGTDPEYGLRRNRRITEKLFKRLLKMPFVRLRTRTFGVVYVDSYPPRKSEEEQALEMQGLLNQESLTVRDDFVAVYLPPFDPTKVHLRDAKEKCTRTAHIAILHIPTQVMLRESVDFNISTIQCFQRQKLAHAQREKLVRVHNAIALFQRIFRQRYEIFINSSITITCLFRMIAAKARTRLLKVERDAANTIEMAYRCYMARSRHFDLRCVSQLSVLKASPGHLPFHGPEKALEHREDTFWIAESPEKAEIRVEFKKKETITEVWIQTSTFSQSPNFVTISAVLANDRTYKDVVHAAELPQMKQHRWMKFAIPFTVTKYFRLVFQENYGDDHQMSVRQIRFLRSIEKSAKILKEPAQFILDQGPTVGDEGKITLKVEAEGWPTPTYQWFKGSRPIPGATQPILNLTLACATYGQRVYRCIKCKMVSSDVPLNAYHIRCGNCSTHFNYKDVEEYDEKIAEVVAEESHMQKEKTSMIASRLQLESFDSDKYIPVIADLTARIERVEDQLQLLREKRIEIKSECEHCNHFSDEGIYYCYVQNYRGGSMRIRRRTKGAAVVVEHSVRYTVPVRPTYIPRAHVKRKKWNVYASIQGTFDKGMLEGLVMIRYNDGSFYEGPYVHEDAIDLLGVTIPEGRPKNHYGLYQTADGRLFEGANIDNHFDPHNLNASYRLTLPNKQGTYEGMFCDEFYHGTGMFTYEDGSVYEGCWFRGTRFGHGHYRSAQGWSYEGFYDTDRRHRHGIINWPDGSCYMGEWYYDQVKGKGIFITPLRDVYKGDMEEGQFHGHGELIYADGSRYVGGFQKGLRHGKGVFTEREGNEFYGQFVDDERHGEHVCKVIVTIEEAGQDNHEVRIGLFNKGAFVKWMSKFSNPIATKQFVKLFRKNREMFDSVFSMILAKNLPALPEGIDANDDQVKAIVFKIRNEAGMLVGEHALNQAQAHLKALLAPIQDKNAEIDALKKDIEAMSIQKIALERDANFYYYKYSNLISKHEKDTMKIEQYWVDEPTEVRAYFNLACEALDTISVDQYFSFRNHRVVPPFVKKIVDAISCLLDIPLEWSTQQFVIADAVANARNGDEEALRYNYRCKLHQMMKTYRVYDHVSIKEEQLLLQILADSRFRRDSYYVQSTGPPGPVLVDWVKTNYAYVKAAREKFEILDGAEQIRLEAFRFKAIQAKKTEEIAEVDKKMMAAQERLRVNQQQLEQLQHALLKANDLLEFISGRYSFGQQAGKLDYYKQMEQKMEEKKDFFTIEVVLRGVIDGVEEIADQEKQQKIREVLASGEKWVEPEVQKPQIMDWIREEVLQQQSIILGNGNTLGYSFEPEYTDITPAYTMQLIGLIIDIITGKLNDIYNDLAEAKSWLSMKGKTISSRFLYVLTWRCWEEEALRLRDAQASAAWEEIFGDADSCARMAIEAKISERMSKVAREQGRVWARLHPDEVAAAERVLAEEFEQMYESVEETARQADDVMLDDSGEVSPTTKAACASWIRLHPEEMNAARDEKNQGLAQLFAEQFPQSTGEVCFKVLNGWGNSEEMEWVAYADHWKSFNMEAYDAAAEALVKEMSGDFEDKYPVATHVECAKVIEHAAIYDYILDAEVKAEYEVAPKELLNANCWKVLHQGMVRKGRQTLIAESNVEMQKQWAELVVQTDSFQKGSVLMSASQPKTMDEQGNLVDRFAGFRNRLLNKFAWVYGYLCLHQTVVLKEIEDLSKKDPLEKVLHRVRPSQLEQVKRAREEEYLAEQRGLEERLAMILDRVAAWNTYFGFANGEGGEEGGWGEEEGGWGEESYEDGEGAPVA